MAFDKKLLEIVACPVCKGVLVLDKTAAGAERLVCRFDRLAYPIEHNIPVLLETEALALSSEELEKITK
ncbi:Trm112 family protein [Paraglaciecola sp. L1A13]|uniref:Trm112 family protein n=1 Tax=Paraglaciecola sp. L1A13 TaxID=2686359 RepID=UPI00131E4ED1|nr:Trm112 family protein [Paraglaciecola sp. L1A13]